MEMIKFNEQEKIDSVNGALALRPQINEIVDEICERGYSNICWLGVGGTWASAMQATVHMKEMSAIETWAENAAEYLTTGNKRITKDTVVIISSVTGNTKEVVDAIKKIKAEVGSTVISFVDAKEAILLDLGDYKISYPVNEQLKFFMVADRFMFNNGELEDYEDMYAEFDKYLAEALVEVEKKAEPFAVEFAKKHWNDEMHYFVGAGNQWGATYSYAMCYWEEQMWIRTKSISCQEFFHGMQEIIVDDTPVTLFMGEDEQRPLAERVARFLPKVNANYTIIDTKEQELKGISPEFRGSISHLVMHGVNNRVDAYMELFLRHPLSIRRYYRQFEY